MNDHFITPFELLVLEAYIGGVFYLFGAVLLMWILIKRFRQRYRAAIAVTLVSVLVAVPLAILIWALTTQLGLDQTPGFHGMGFFHVPALLSMLVVSLVCVLLVWRYGTERSAT